MPHDTIRVPDVALSSSKHEDRALVEIHQPHLPDAEREIGIALEVAVVDLRRTTEDLGREPPAAHRPPRC
jgi:hypothetical protein